MLNNKYPAFGATFILTNTCHALRVAFMLNNENHVLQANHTLNKRMTPIITDGSHSFTKLLLK